MHVADGGLLRGAGAAIPDAVVLGRRSVALTSDCRPAAIRPGARIVARLDGCLGPPLRLRAAVRSRCRVLRGRLTGRGLAPTVFTAHPSRCGDGVVDRLAGEHCDDRNQVGGDGCAADCRSCEAGPPLASTWEGVQVNILLRYGCLRCHDSAAAIGGLDLRPGSAYRQLVGAATDAVPGLRFVEPGDHLRSYLWLKLAKATDPTPWDALPGAGMPLDGALTAGELAAVGAWIDAGAVADGVVPGTEPLLASCRPPSEGR